jgi:type II secretory pathway component PulJ
VKLRRRPPPLAAARRRARDSFTLLEVVIAMGIFFAGIFAILNLVSENLQFARQLNQGEPDLGTVAAELFMEAATNQDLRAGGGAAGDFGELYPGASWSAELHVVLTNSTSRGRNGDPGLYQADITISWPRNNLIKERKTSLLLYLP